MREDLAFVFPGQGSQRIGMLAGAAGKWSSVTDTFAEASEALGFDLWHLTQAGDEDELRLTHNTQPALLVASVALWRVWNEAGGPRPAALSGHSLGEFSALCCAGSLELGDAARLVRARGEFMQTAVPVGEGAMAAVLGLEDQQVTDVCNSVSAQTSAVVEAVNFNAPGQVVIAGATAAVDVAIGSLKEAGARRAVPLPVSAPFHTSLMSPAGERLSEVLADLDIQAPSIPVVHNVSAATESSPAAIHDLLVRQISSPVRWTECVGTLIGHGAANFVECGAGKVLAGLMRRIDKSTTAFAIEEPADLDAALQALA